MEMLTWEDFCLSQLLQPGILLAKVPVCLPETFVYQDVWLATPEEATFPRHACCAAFGLPEPWLREG